MPNFYYNNECLILDLFPVKFTVALLIMSSGADIEEIHWIDQGFDK